MNPPDEVNPNFGFRVKTSQTLMSRSIEIETSRFSKDERPKTTRWCVKSVWFSQKISPVNFPAVSDGKRQTIMSPPLPDEMNSESSSPGARETQLRCESSDDLRNYEFLSNFLLKYSKNFLNFKNFQNFNFYKKFKIKSNWWFFQKPFRFVSRRFWQLCRLYAFWLVNIPDFNRSIFGGGNESILRKEEALNVPVVPAQFPELLRLRHQVEVDDPVTESDRALFAVLVDLDHLDFLVLFGFLNFGKSGVQQIVNLTLAQII